VKEGITFCLSLPLDYQAGAYSIPAGRRQDWPPRSEGASKFLFSARGGNPDFTDVISDDLVFHAAVLDAVGFVRAYRQPLRCDGDGEREIVFYNGFRAGADVRPAPENASGEPWRSTRERRRARSASRTLPSTARRARVLVI